MFVLITYPGTILVLNAFPNRTRWAAMSISRCRSLNFHWRDGRELTLWCTILNSAFSYPVHTHSDIFLALVAFDSGRYDDKAPDFLSIGRASEAIECYSWNSKNFCLCVRFNLKAEPVDQIKRGSADGPVSADIAANCQSAKSSTVSIGDIVYSRSRTKVAPK